MKPLVTQVDALKARARRLLADHRTCAKKDGATLDYTLTDLRELLASSPTCAYCKLPLSFAVSLDHRQPLSRGGRHSLDNLTVCCERCNRLKGMLTAEEFRLLRDAVTQLHPVAAADVERRLLAGAARYASRRRK